MSPAWFYSTTPALISPSYAAGRSLTRWTKTLTSATIPSVPHKDPAKRRQYARAHYEKHADVYKERAKLARTERRLRIARWIRELKSAPCTDCQIKYPYYVMQFDHARGQKEFGLHQASRVGMSRAKVEAELAKCDIVCANCHAARTWQRQEGARLAA